MRRVPYRRWPRKTLLTKRWGWTALGPWLDQMIASYAVLGKKAEKVEVDRAVIYLATASKDGAVQMLDGETGEVIWATTVGDYRLPTIGPGLNDQYVAVINGNHLYICDVLTGRFAGPTSFVAIRFGSSAARFAA